MLKHLHIKNYALIDALDIDFSSGFSVITGETGAGKSIILGAIGLLLGQRADIKALKPNTPKCIIEARFNISKYGIKEWFDTYELDCDEEECLLRRELTATGKSRAFINDTPVSLQLMREIGEKLVDVHSQHQNLLLQNEDFQLKVLDTIAENSNLKTLYETAFKEYCKAEKELKELKEEISQAKANEDFMRFQLNELTNACLKENEQEELEQEQETATHTEEIKTLLFEAGELLNNESNGILTGLRQTSGKLESATKLYPKIAELYERIDTSFIEMKDVAQEIESIKDCIDFDPIRLASINERLDTLYSLQRKFHKNTVSELIEEQKTLQETIDNIDNSETSLTDYEEKVNKLLAKVQTHADKLTASRNKVIAQVEKDISDYLTSLGMPNAIFKIEIAKDQLSTKGQDKVAFLFSANKGMPLRPVAQVASGGEIARLMLSLKALISGVVKLPTIIFDEIDTGVSGYVAERMADIMRQMGNADRQVISITHLPQIAALGLYHYKVEKQETKENTTSVLRKLSDSERIDEIAQMLSGSSITEAARTNAKALLRQ